MAPPLQRLARPVFATVSCLFAALAGAAPLTIAIVPSALGLPVYVADAEHDFQAEGVEVQVVACADGPVCLKQLFDRRADRVDVTEMPIVLASFDRPISPRSRPSRATRRRSPGAADLPMLFEKLVEIGAAPASAFGQQRRDLFVNATGRDCFGKAPRARRLACSGRAPGQARQRGWRLFAGITLRAGPAWAAGRR